MTDDRNPSLDDSPPTRGGAGSGLPTLLAACALTGLLWFVPYASLVTYPIRLLVTFLHEGGHALAALATGGAVAFIRIFPDGSGVTGTRGGSEIAIVSAGYLGATLYGALLLALGRGEGRRSRGLLLSTGGFVGALTLLFVRPWDNLFGFGWGVALTLALAALGLRLPARAAGWLCAFLGVQCVLNALFDLRTLLNLSVGVGGGATTDAVLMSRIFPLPPVVWAVSWLLLSVGLLWWLLAPRRGGVVARAGAAR
jgi:hypothetical protein